MPTCNKCKLERLILTEGICDFCNNKDPNEHVTSKNVNYRGVEVKGGDFKRRTNTHLV